MRSTATLPSGKPHCSVSMVPPRPAQLTRHLLPIDFDKRRAVEPSIIAGDKRVVQSEILNWQHGYVVLRRLWRGESPCVLPNVASCRDPMLNLFAGADPQWLKPAQGR